MENQIVCPMIESRITTSRRLAEDAVVKVMNQSVPKMNAIWLEVTGCSGNIISFLESDTPNAYEVLKNIVNMTFDDTIMGEEGYAAYQRLLDTLKTDFILLVDGAISMADEGAYNIIAISDGKPVTAFEALKLTAAKAKYVIAVGTCACHGGISAARPNPSGCVSVKSALNRAVIQLPGCPCHPDWVVGTVAHLVAYGMPELDSENRPILFYGTTIHDNCTRRGFFDAGNFATKFGEPGCMFKLGCRGPVTRTDCPRRQWNGYVNWPIGNNTTCIGCAHSYFPDGMEPFVRY